MKKRSCFLIVGVGALIVCVAVIVIGLILVQQERKAVTEAYGDEIAEMCNPPAGGAVDLANLPDSPRPLKALVLEAGDRMRYEWHDDLEDDYKAEDREALGVVVCVTERDEVIESCDYTPAEDEDSEDVAFTIERVQKYADLVLLNPDSGLRIAELSVQGGLPKDCPDTARSSSKKVSYDGPKVSYNEFLIVIEPYLKGEVQ